MGQAIRRANTEKNVLSFSKIDKFLRCKWLWYQEYVLLIPTKPSKNMVYGTEIHTLVEQIVKKKADSIEALNEMPEYIKASKEDKEKAHSFAAWHMDKIQVEEPEYYACYKIGDNVEYEIHIDNIFKDQYNNLYFEDTKTNAAPVSKDELYHDEQLRMYAWSYLKHTKLDFTPNKIIIGHWLWQHNNFVGVDFDNQDDYTNKLVSMFAEMQRVENDKDKQEFKDLFPKEVNKHCRGCDYLNSCVPDSIPDTYNGIQCRINQLKGQLEIKKLHLLTAFDELNTTVLPAEKERGYYCLSTRKDSDLDVDDFIDQITDKIGNKKTINMKKLKPTIKPTKDYCKNLGITVKEVANPPILIVKFKNKL